jgi:hypothetical protein
VKLRVAGNEDARISRALKSIRSTNTYRRRLIERAFANSSDSAGSRAALKSGAQLPSRRHARHHRLVAAMIDHT